MQPRRAFFKSGKSCGCVIASNIISLEILRKKLAKAKSSSKISIVRKQKKYMKKKFEDYVKKSGYVPPKLKTKSKTKGGKNGIEFKGRGRRQHQHKRL